VSFRIVPGDEGFRVVCKINDEAEQAIFDWFDSEESAKRAIMDMMSMIQSLNN
jgi:hypothetical protein